MRIYIATLLALLPTMLLGQVTPYSDQPVMKGIGLKFAADFAYYNRPEDYPAIDGTYSYMVLGAAYKQYFDNALMEVGANFLFKGGEDGFQLPLVMADYPDTQNTSLAGAELDLKVGPRFGIFTPKIGARLQYRWTQTGMLEDTFQGRPTEGEFEMNPLVLFLPIGFSIDLPTGFGSTGIGAYYNFGITNAISTGNLETGGTLRAFNFEIHVMLRTD